MYYQKSNRYRVCLIVLFLMYGFFSFAQENCEQESMMYLKAFHYIKDDIKNSPYVSDTIVYIDGIFFLTELSDFPIEKERIEQLYLEHYTKDKEHCLSEFLYSSCLANTFPRKYKDANYIVFFSSIDDNILFASVFPAIKKKNNRYNEKDMYSFHNVSRFTTEQLYMFIFDKRKRRFLRILKTTIQVD